MAQKKFGQYSFKVWFPEPRGGRFENWTHRNLNDADFRDSVNEAIERLQKLINYRDNARDAEDKA